jgi:peptidoglycan DL-endopeptidase CwlO
LSSAAVIARISEIQAKFASPMLPAAASAANGAAFAQVLSGVNGTSATTSTMTTTAAGAGGVTGDAVISAAKKYLGVPYVWGGTDPSKGLDCSGFVQRVYKDMGINLPRVSRDQAKAGTAVASLAQAKPGDLVAFGSPVNHIGIYMGGGKMIVAPHKGDVVKIQNVYKTPTAIRRILPEGGVSQVASTMGVAAGRPASLGTGGINGTLPASVPYREQFIAAGRKHGVSPRLLAAVAKAESGFNPKAVSGAGARGLMQIMPSTARGLGVDPMNPAQAIDGAAKLLASHMRRFGSVELALAAYNAGPGAVVKYDGIPPYRETQNYVPKVLRYARGSA